MVNWIIIRKVDGTKQAIIIPEDATEVTIEAKDMKVKVDLPLVYAKGHVHTTITLPTLPKGAIEYEQLPEVSLYVGEKADNDKGFKWATAAMMYITNGGRIMGRNQTLGYSTTDKPLAPSPWKRPKNE